MSPAKNLQPLRTLCVRLIDWEAASLAFAVMTSPAILDTAPLGKVEPAKKPCLNGNQEAGGRTEEEGSQRRRLDLVSKVNSPPLMECGKPFLIYISVAREKIAAEVWTS